MITAALFIRLLDKKLAPFLFVWPDVRQRPAAFYCYLMPIPARRLAMKFHSFDTREAQKYGVHAALLLHSLRFWIEKNRASNKNYIEGNWWTYNTAKAWAALFPYLTARQVRTALKKLEKCGVLEVANHNKSKYDRTLWYALTENRESICAKEEIHFTKTSNQSDQNVEPIPDIIPDTIPDIIPGRESARARGSGGLEVLEDAEIAYQEYNSAAEKYDFQRAQGLTSSRKRRLNKALELLGGLQQWRDILQSAGRSDFLRGRGRTSFICTLDFLLKEDSLLKIKEGAYHEKRKSKGINWRRLV